MKVPPKRKGNSLLVIVSPWTLLSLNESPSEKEGKLSCGGLPMGSCGSLNESPSEKEGKSCRSGFCSLLDTRAPQ